MGVHLKGQKTQPTFESANRLLASVNTFFDEHREHSRFVSYDDIDRIDMSVFLTTVVENLHAVSHMKHKTFSTYEYAQDLGKIFKEAIKRSTACGHHYFTKPESYYPIPEHPLSLKDVPQMSQLPSKPSAIKIERSEVRKWVKDFRPVRQRTVRGETTKDKSGMLPPAVYANTGTDFTVRELQLYDGQPEEVQHLILDENEG